MQRALLATALTMLFGAAHADVGYQLRILDAAHHLAQVSAAFPAAAGATLDLHMPIWRTGRYEILNLANGVRRVKAVNQKGEALPVAKLDEGSWRVQTHAGDQVTVSYELYANLLGERTRHIDDTHAYLDASGVFVYADAYRAQPATVKLDVPAAWTSRSGMEPGNCAHCFVAPNYDVLIDSPIETGIHQFYTSQVDGKEIDLAIWGRGNYDGKQMIADLDKIVAQTGKLFGGNYPYKQRYLFIVHATDGFGGATEHINSTVIQIPRWRFHEHKDYLRFLNTAAHEFVHTWNVKAYRPKEMVPYDYQHANTNPLLWVAEGNTDYFAGLVTLGAGLQTRDEFLDIYAKGLDDYRHTPGRFEQSATDSSFDQWIASGDADHERNASVNIYPKGQLLGLAMDLQLRRQTHGARGLIDVHRILYTQHSVAQGGYDAADIRAALKQVSGQDWSDWWAQYVDGTAEIPFDGLLADVGLQTLVDVPKDADDKQEWWAGWRVREGSDPAVVTQVERDSPAWKAGIVPGDTLLAVNGVRVSGKDLGDKLTYLGNAPFKVHLFRRDELMELAVAPIRQPKGKPKLKALDKPTAAQKSLDAAWLGLPWPKDEPAKK